MVERQRSEIDIKKNKNMFLFPVLLLFVIAIIVYGFVEDNSTGASSYNTPNETPSYAYDDVAADVFVAVVKLTPDLHVSGDNLKKRMKEYAETAFIKIYGSAGVSRANQFELRIDKKEQIKVKNLAEKVQSTLKGVDFQYKKEILIGMWSLAYADGQATVDQQKLISIIGKAMGLSLTACNKVETMFWQRMKAGKYGDYNEFEKRRDKWFEDEEVRKREKEFERKRKENSQSNNTNKQKVDYSTLSPELLKAYAVLGLDPSASTSEVKSQKNNLLKRYHPDLFANQGDEMIRKATIKAQSINQAYETIMKGRA